jgi:hypothetical protein
VNTPRKPDDDLDRLLADDGGELGALYRRLPRMEPPRRLDRNVLGEAARAIHGRPPRRQRWMVGLGSAAGIVLAAGVAWHVGQDALRQQSYEPARSAPTYVPVQPLDESSRRRHADAPAAADAIQPAPAPAAPAATAPMEFQHRRSAPPVDKLKKEAAPEAQSAPPPTAVAAPPPPQRTVSTPSEPFPSSDKSANATSANAEAKGNLAGSAAREQESGRSEDAASASLAAKPAHSTTGPAPTSSAELRRDMQLAPEDWLAHIQQLLRQGRRQQAIESLQLFRRAHPDWQLSDELRALSE